MRGPRFAYFSLLALAFVPLRAWAPIFFSFPGLQLLTERADDVVVAEVLPPADGRAGNSGYSIHTIRVLVALKGEIRAGTEITAQLRALPMGMNYELMQGRLGFMAKERYVLFLAADNAPESRVTHRSTNDVGNSFWVPPSSELTSLPVSDMYDAIRSLLDDVLAYEIGRLAELRELAASYLE